MKYNICIIKNKLPKQLDLKKYLVDWFEDNTPLEIELNVIETDFEVKTKNVANGTFKGVIVDSEDIIPKIRTVVPEGKYNAVLLIYGNTLNGIRVSACDGSIYPDTEFIQTYVYNDKGVTANHELFHAFFQKLRKCQIGLQDPMDTYIRNNDLEVDNQINTNREMALKLLQPYWDKICAFRNLNEVVKPVQKYKYFSEKEIVGLKPELVELLDKAREIAGIPFVITSGYRTIAHNEEVGGVKDSSHSKGLAVDLRARDSHEHYLITKALFEVGFKRISRHYPSHIHCDIDSSKAQEVLF